MQTSTSGMFSSFLSMFWFQTTGTTPLQTLEIQTRALRVTTSLINHKDNTLSIIYLCGQNTEPEITARPQHPHRVRKH